MSRWHRENPNYLETGATPPDPRERADRERQARKDGDFEISSGSYEELPCIVCGGSLTRNGTPCEQCRESIEYDRLERESGR